MPLCGTKIEYVVMEGQDIDEEYMADNRRGHSLVDRQCSLIEAHSLVPLFPGWHFPPED